AGAYNVVHLVPGGYNQTAPGGDGRYHVNLAAADAFSGNFGDRLPPATITGTVFDDLNANAKQDAGEPVVPGVTVYLDINNNGMFDAGDISVTSDANGQYSFSDLVPNKDYTVAEVTPNGYVHTTPFRNGLVASPNVNTSKRSGQDAETAIAIDPTNPNR